MSTGIAFQPARTLKCRKLAGHNSMMDFKLTRKIEEQAKSLARHSWEYGVVFDALLETHSPHLSVYASAVPPPAFDLEVVPALQFARKFIKTDRDTLIDGEG
jgi:hypothetical protein